MKKYLFIFLVSIAFTKVCNARGTRKKLYRRRHRLQCECTENGFRLGIARFLVG